MKDKIENKFFSSLDVQDSDGNIFGAVFVSPAKEFGKRNIILIDETRGTYSARSITELINMLSKRNVTFAEKKRVLDFLSERLRILEKDLEFNTLQQIKEFNDEK
jgi:predicted nuclease of restriction endonuclease-like (RecB) superfamily